MENYELIGKRFGRLVVLSQIATTNDRHSMFLCQCDCGEKINVRKSNLITNHSTSCGCSRTVHGLRHTQLYHKYQHMIQRCNNPNCDAYKNYGGRGISVCEEWINKETGFTAFYNWSIEHGYDPKLDLDRINNDGNYEPSNCRYVTRKVNANNRRTCKKRTS